MSVQLALTDTFVEALASLAPSEGKRATAFLDKIIHSADAPSLRPEIVHDAKSRAIRSFRVTHDLRAIGHVAGDELTLVYVGQHDEAYRWASKHCVDCDPHSGKVTVTPLAV